MCDSALLYIIPIRIVICKIFGARVATPALHISVLCRRIREETVFIDSKLETRGGTPSIQLPPSPMLEVLCTHTSRLVF